MAAFAKEKMTQGVKYALAADNYADYLKGMETILEAIDYSPGGELPAPDPDGGAPPSKEAVVFSQEEIIYIATVLDGVPAKTRQAAIYNMRLALPGSIISESERAFIRNCVKKLEAITNRDFNNIDFLSAWALTI